MAKYCPDRWCVVKITTDKEVLYKVLGSWYGNYPNGSSWRLNSGIVRVLEAEDAYLFYGTSGSCYVCQKDSYGLHSLSAGALVKWAEETNNQVSLMSSDTDWRTVSYEESL